MTTEQRLPIKEVVVIRGAEVGAVDQDGTDLGQRLATDTGCLVVWLDEGVTLETLDEDDMRANGWVRA